MAEDVVSFVHKHEGKIKAIRWVERSTFAALLKDGREVVGTLEYIERIIDGKDEKGCEPPKGNRKFQG